MAIAKISEKGREVTVTLKVELTDSMLKNEFAIREALNEGGQVLTEKALKRFDTNGEAIIVGGQKLTVQRYNNETYQSAYGEFNVERHVYQSSEGGKTFCPMEVNARIVIKSTPHFARIISFKYAKEGAIGVSKDLQETLNLKVNKSFVQRIGEAVGTFIGAKEEKWEYALPEMEKPTKTVSIGLDGTMMLLCEDGWREAMVGTIALYDKDGERQHTIYTASTPEYGKERFLSRLSKEIENVKKRIPRATFIGLADGAQCNWPYLQTHTEHQIVDFYHSSEYLGLASDTMFRLKKDKDEWLENSRHRLKHNKTGAKQLLKEMTDKYQNTKLSQIKEEKLKRSITFFRKNSPKMQYSEHQKKNRPIGSGVTESAAKVLVKQRLCNSGMRWKEAGAATVLQIRTKILTNNRWDEIWDKIDRYGFTRVAA